MALIDRDAWLNDFYTDFSFRDESFRVPKSALAQFADSPTNLYRQYVQHGGDGDSGMSLWGGEMDNAYRMLSTPDASGRLRYGTEIRGFAPNTQEGGAADIMLDGKPFLRVGAGYDEYVQAFKANGLDPSILRPEQFGYDERYGHLADPYAAKKWGEMFKAAGEDDGLMGGLENFLDSGGGVGLLAAGLMGPVAAAGGLGAEGLAGAEALAGGGGSSALLGGASGDTLGIGLDVAGKASGFPAGAAGAFDAAGVGTGVDFGTTASGAGLGQGVTGPTFSSVAGPTLGSNGGISNILSRLGTSATNLLKGDASGDDLKTLGTAATVGGGALALGGAVASGGLGGSTTQTSSTAFPGMSDEERELIKLNAELTKRQLAAIDQLQPFQKAMLEAALDELTRAQADSAAVSGAISPQEQADFTRQEFERSKRLGPIQDEIMQMQLDSLRRGGAATPEQEALIRGATDSAIGSANADIDAATSRGIGLIADELSNSRGLRLSDSPMSGEAALLAREGVIQKGGIEKSLRANQANAQLNYPLAVQELSAKTSQIPLTIADAAKRFQEDLRTRAFNNRMSLIGTGVNTGIGLSSVGGGNGALNALTQSRLNSGTQTVTQNRGIGLTDVGGFASGIGGLMTGLERFFR